MIVRFFKILNCTYYIAKLLQYWNQHSIRINITPWNAYMSECLHFWFCIVVKYINVCSLRLEHAIIAFLLFLYLFLSQLLPYFSIKPSFHMHTFLLLVFFKQWIILLILKVSNKVGKLFIALILLSYFMNTGLFRLH